MPRQRCLLLVVFFVILPVLFYWSFWQSAWMHDDTPSYLPNAMDIANFKMPADPDRVPLICLFYALTGVVSENSDTSWLLLVHLLMHGMVVFIVMYMLEGLKIPKTVSIAAAVLLWSPLYSEQAGYTMTVTFTEFLLALTLLGIYQFLKRQTGWPLYIAAASSALVALVRPTFQLLSPFLILILIAVVRQASWVSLKMRNIMRISFVFLLPFLFFVGGWASYNYFQHGLFGLTRLYGFELPTRTVTVVERLPESMGEVREILLKHRDQSIVAHHKSHTGYMYICGAIPELLDATGMNYTQLSRYMFQVHKSLIVKAPLNYLLEVGKSSAMYWLPWVTARSFGNSRKLQFIWSALGLAVNILFLCLPIIIALKLAFSEFRYGNPRDFFLTRASFFIATGIIIYNWFISCGYSAGVPRLRKPTDFLIVFAVATVLFSKSEAWRVERKYLKRCRIIYKEDRGDK